MGIAPDVEAMVSRENNLRAFGKYRQYPPEFGVGSPDFPVIPSRVFLGPVAEVIGIVQQENEELRIGLDKLDRGIGQLGDVAALTATAEMGPFFSLWET